MALTRKKRYRNITMRKAVRTGPGTKALTPPTSPVSVTGVVHSASILTVTFGQPVIYSGILPGWTNNSQHVIGVAATSPTVWVLTLSGASAAGAVNIPFQDAAFRNASGGYVNAGVLTAT
jgi:hypothetical protein